VVVANVTQIFIAHELEVEALEGYVFDWNNASDMVGYDGEERASINRVSFNSKGELAWDEIDAVLLRN
jgi:hypothetical protein